MSPGSSAERTPADRRARIAVDLGAESCRVSLLRWPEGRPTIELVHRFPNGARLVGQHLRWDLPRIEAGLETGLRRAAEIATEGVASLAVDGWAVDYVRLDGGGQPLAEPFCYRDERTVEAERMLHTRISPARMRLLSGVQLLRINTVYQLFADRLAGLDAGTGWLNLPEYLLHRWGGRRVAEYTNATHTQMVEVGKPAWCGVIFEAAGLALDGVSPIVLPGTVVGQLRGPLAKLQALRDVRLIAPACHDTASAVAGIPATGDDWAYISSGTWSLVGTVLDKPCLGEAMAGETFTNLAGVGGRFCYHRNVNGMWLLRQCMESWAEKGESWEIADLVAAAGGEERPEALLEVDDPDLWLAGEMPARINMQLRARGQRPIEEGRRGAPAIANLVLHSLAARYAEVLREIQRHTGRKFRRLFIVGGGSQNELLNRLTAEATGLEVLRGAPESSTLGNLAVQLATMESEAGKGQGATADRVAAWAAVLGRAPHRKWIAPSEV